MITYKLQSNYSKDNYIRLFPVVGENLEDFALAAIGWKVDEQNRLVEKDSGETIELVPDATKTIQKIALEELGWSIQKDDWQSFIYGRCAEDDEVCPFDKD